MGVVMMREQQPWLDVPFGEKDDAKAAGALWDWRAKRWYAPRPGMAELARWLPAHRDEAPPAEAASDEAASAPEPTPPDPVAVPPEVLLAEALRWLTEPNVLARLTRRRPPWRVLHAVPAGAGHGDLDHVLIGPPGVVTVTVERHPGRAVRVDGDRFTVDGEDVGHVPRARARAERAGRLLAAALGGDAGAAPPVIAALAVDAASVTPEPGGELPSGVLVTTPASLSRLVTALPAALDDREIDKLYAVARRLGTWTRDL
ncbi:DUF5710 domain-containing protein [Actinomycetospora sp. NBC_00405]|uniref:DUF5710 domain-containing protein n=1 Tax=Actinomycetospora sp. NBC_00405 TaxID=2975952 RepID=UPI002E215A5E